MNVFCCCRPGRNTTVTLCGGFYGKPIYNKINKGSTNMKQYLASLLVVIFALCTVPSLSVADAAAPPIQYAEDHELTPYSFENFQDKLSIQLDEKWKQFVFFWPEDNHVEVDEHVLTSLPVVATNQQEVVLLTFQRDSNDQQWNLSSANEKALIPSIHHGVIKLRAFSCWKVYENSLQDINLYYSIETSDNRYSFQSCFTHVAGIETNWRFEVFVVQTSEPIESQYVQQLFYDCYTFVLTRELTGSIGYARNEEDVLGFDLDSVEIQQFNARTFDINQYLSPLALMTQTVVDTSKHGNGKMLILRDGPGGEKIGKLSNGSEVFISSMQSEWAFLIGKNKAGFVNTKFIKGTNAYLQQD